MAGDVKIDFAGIGGLVSGLGSAAKDVRAAITGKSVLDPDKQAELEMKLAEIEQKAQDSENAVLLAQAEINAKEAESKSFFVSSWRPAIGWVCAFGCGYAYLIYPTANWVARVIFKYALELPTLDMQSLSAMTLGLLGLAGMRTAEKIKGVASK
jgi:hypothetical protein